MNQCWIGARWCPVRERRPISWKAAAVMPSIASRAAKCVWICSSVNVASNCATRSAETHHIFPQAAHNLNRAGINQEIVKTAVVRESTAWQRPGNRRASP